MKPLIKQVLMEATILWVEFEVAIRRNDIDDYNRELRELNDKYTLRASATSIKNTEGE